MNKIKIPKEMSKEEYAEWICDVMDQANLGTVALAKNLIAHDGSTLNSQTLSNIRNPNSPNLLPEKYIKSFCDQLLVEYPDAIDIYLDIYFAVKRTQIKDQILKRKKNSK